MRAIAQMGFFLTGKVSIAIEEGEDKEWALIY